MPHTAFRRSPHFRSVAGGRSHNGCPLCSAYGCTAVVARGAFWRLQVGLALSAVRGRVFCVGHSCGPHDGVGWLRPCWRSACRTRTPSAADRWSAVPCRHGGPTLRVDVGAERCCVGLRRGFPLPVPSQSGSFGRPYHPRAPPPNKRLKLTAPGLGRNCVCALASAVVVSINVAPTWSGAAA